MYIILLLVNWHFIAKRAKANYISYKQQRQVVTRKVKRLIEAKLYFNNEFKSNCNE